MTLSAGTRLGQYEIQSPLGAGGMGEVYRARDTRLSRNVAIKVLLAAVASDSEGLARFSREAQLLASLNHPHIAQIYGLEDAGDVRALVMELVEGPTLEDRIAQGAIPLDEALPIAKQIAEALEAAHDQGVIHRDLKPANIKVRPDGTVKVLDFGLAKALDPGGVSSASPTMSPTLSYADNGMLLAVRFDLERLEVVSDPVSVVERVMMASGGAANYAVSRAGTLVYVPGRAIAQTPRSLVWVDRNGREESIKAPLRAYVIPRLSPDGTRAALDIRDQERDIWIWDFARETLKPLTFGPSLDEQPVWTPDGQRIVFGSDRDGAANLYRQAADGTGAVDRLTTSGNVQVPTSINPAGTGVVGYENSPATLFDVVLFPLGASRVEPLVQTPSMEQNGEVSPDGRYLAYQSNESGRSAIYVRPFPQVNGGRWRVSAGGGTRPAWARTGRELFYLDTSNTLMVVPVQTSGTTFSSGNPSKVFDTQYAAPVTSRTYDVSPDGKRFLMLKEDEGSDANATQNGIIVVLNGHRMSYVMAAFEATFGGGRPRPDASEVLEVRFVSEVDAEALRTAPWVPEVLQAVFRKRSSQGFRPPTWTPLTRA